MTVKAPRGTQDILPERTPAWNRVEASFRDRFLRHGFEELRTPVFEHTELFQRGVGEATDIVQKEMYTFADRKGRSLTLRPEGTASVARAYVEHKFYAAPAPFKVYYVGPMFRYERPQAGRFRQHQQLGAELLGSASPLADFEMIALLVDALAALGVSSMAVLLNSVGDENCRPRFTDELRGYLTRRTDDLCTDCRRRLEQNPLRVLDCKVEGCRQVVAGMPSIQDHLCPACREHQTRVVSLLDGAGITYRLDDQLVRGLDYYTRTVFEVQHGGLGAQSAVGGGGRYDHLVEEVGGPPTPGVGFSTGVERILLALEAEGLTLPGVGAPDVTVVVIGGDRERQAGALLARRLRRRFRVETDLLDRSPSQQMKQASRLGSRLAVLVGEGELAEHSWTVKDMTTARQEKIGDEGLESHLERLLAGDVTQGEPS